jgi:hypothetical protein
MQPSLIASKAFDVVWHESMLRKLLYTGISKETWILTKMLYQDLHSKVKWEGKICSPYHGQISKSKFKNLAKCKPKDFL